MAGLGLIGGIGTAVALAALVVAVVTVTATTSSGGPPLLLHLDALALFAVCACYALGAAAVVWSVTRGAPR